MLNYSNMNVSMTESSSINEETKILVDGEKWNFTDVIFWYFLIKSW